MNDEKKQHQFGQQQKQERPPVPAPDKPLPPVSPEERLSRDFNLEPRTREANARQINESFHAPDSAVHETKEPQKAHK